MAAFDNTAPVAKSVSGLAFNTGSNQPVPSKIVGTPPDVPVAELALVGGNLSNPDSPASYGVDIDGIGGDTVDVVLLCNQTDPEENGIWETATGSLVYPGTTNPVFRVTGPGDYYADTLFERQPNGSFRNVGATSRQFNKTAPTPV